MLKDMLMDYMRDKKLSYSFVIENLKTGRQISANEGFKTTSASIIKIFIMGAVIELAKKNVLSLHDRVKISPSEKVPYSVISLLDEENTYTIKDLITLMIIQSDNTATNKLIDIAGMDKINGFIKENGFKNTILQRKMMDSSARIEGRENFTSAGDVKKFLELMYKSELVDDQSSLLMLDIMLNQLDGSMMRINLPDGLKVAHKSGDLELLKHDVGIVYTENVDYIFVMMTWNAESDNYARNVIGHVSSMTYDYFLSGDDLVEDC